MPPAFFLILLIVLTAAGAAVAHQLQRREKQALRSLAAQWQMHYTQHDLFHLTDRVAGLFPVPGAADLAIAHVIYALQDDRYRYYFTAEFTIGGGAGQQRLRRGATFSEAHDDAGQAQCTPIVLASSSVPLEEQYRALGRLNGEESRVPLTPPSK